MTLIEIFSIIIIHWVCDFVLQTDKMAKGKSKNWRDLLMHTSVYSLMWSVPIYMLTSYGGFELVNSLFGGPKILLFIPITFICHTITDYFTSRLNYKL